MKKIFLAFLFMFCLNLQSQNVITYKCESCDYKDKVNGNWSNWQGVYSCKVDIKIDFTSKTFEFTSSNGNVVIYKIQEVIKSGKDVYGQQQLVVNCIDSDNNECKIDYTLSDNKYILALIYIEYKNKMVFYSLT